MVQKPVLYEEDLDIMMTDDNDDFSPLIVERSNKVIQKHTPSGRRIVDIAYFIKQGPYVLTCDIKSPDDMT
jgi:hypothetical protein